MCVCVCVRYKLKLCTRALLLSQLGKRLSNEANHKNKHTHILVYIILLESSLFETLLRSFFYGMAASRETSCGAQRLLPNIELFPHGIGCTALCNHPIQPTYAAPFTNFRYKFFVIRDRKNQLFASRKIHPSNTSRIFKFLPYRYKQYVMAGRLRFERDFSSLFSSIELEPCRSNRFKFHGS